MSDRFTQQVRDALHDTAAAAEISSPDLDSVRADADRRRPRDGRILQLAVAAVALVVLGLVTVQVLDRPTAVVLEDGSSAVSATADALIGRTFTSTSALAGAPAPDGVLTMRFIPPQNAEEDGPGRVTMSVSTDPGCNDGGAVLAVVAGGQTQLVTSFTEMAACTGTPGDMDDWWRDLIQAEPILLLDGDRLVVRTNAGQIDMIDDSTVAGVLPAPPEDSFSPLASISPSTVEPGDRTIEMQITAADQQLRADTNFRVQRWDGEEWQWQYYVDPNQGLSPGVGALKDDGYDIQPGETLTEELPLMYLRRGIYRVGLVMRVSGGATDGTRTDVYARLVVGQPTSEAAATPAGDATESPALETAQPPTQGALDPTAAPMDASHTPMAVPTMTAPPAGACGPQSTGTIEFADVLTLNGRTYHAVAPDRGPTAVTVGALHTTTSCRLADGAPLDGEPRPDGAAAYLAVGTPIHEVNGHDPAFRVVALSGQDTVMYQSLEATAAGHPLAALEAVSVDFAAQGTTRSLGSPSVRADELITALQEGGPVAPAQDQLLCSDRVNLSVTLSDGSIISVIVYPAADAAALHMAPEYLPLAPAIIETLVAEAPAEATSSGSFACD